MERERERARLVLNAAKASAAAAQAELALFEIETRVTMKADAIGVEEFAIKPEKLAHLGTVTGSNQGLPTQPSTGLISQPTQFTDFSTDIDVDRMKQEEPAVRPKLPNIVKQHNHYEQMSTSQGEKDNTAYEHPVIVDFDGYARMTERKIDGNSQVQKHFVSQSSDERLREGLVGKVNADASILSSERDEHSARQSKGNRGAGDLEGGKADLTSAAQNSQVLGAVDSIPCPYAASFRCELSFGTDGMALLHGAMHLAGKGKRPCPYAIQLKCAKVFTRDSEALRHGKGHTQERSRSCPGCKKKNILKDQIKAHWRNCKAVQDITGEREGAKWLELAHEPDLIEWELERAYYCQEAEEWKLR